MRRELSGVACRNSPNQPDRMHSRARRSARLARWLFPFDDLLFSLWIAYNRPNVRPPEGEYFVSVLSRPWAARVGRTVPSIRISFAVTLRP